MTVRQTYAAGGRIDSALALPTSRYNSASLPSTFDNVHVSLGAIRAARTVDSEDSQRDQRSPTALDVVVHVEPEDE